MKHMLTICCALFLLACPAFAQTFKAPANYSMKTAEDCRKYNKDVLACIDWMEQTSLSDVMQQADVLGFFMAWIESTSDVTINMDENLFPAAAAGAEGLLYFIAGCTRYSLSNTAAYSDVKCITSGFKMFASMYKRNPGAIQNAEIKKIVAMNDDGSLEAWVTEMLKK